MRKVIRALLVVTASVSCTLPAWSMSLYLLLADCCKDGNLLCCTGLAFLDWM